MDPHWRKKQHTMPTLSTPQNVIEKNSHGIVKNGLT